MPEYAGFDLGGTQLKYGLIDDGYTVTYQDAVDTPQETEELILVLESLWKKLKQAASGPVAAAGFGFPGILSSRTRKILQSPNYPSIENVDLYPSLEKFIPVPVIVDNDANVAAYGEYKAGAGRGAHSMVLLTIGTGVGTGIIIEGGLLHGACGFAGELGHAPVNNEGEPCNCGSYGCLETEVSAAKIVRKYREISGIDQAINSQEIYHRAGQGDKAAVEAFARAGRFLGIGIAIAINALNPDKIILGGGVMQAGDLLLKPAVKEARRRSYRGAYECCSILPAELGNDAGFIGAAGLAHSLL